MSDNNENELDENKVPEENNVDGGLVAPVEVEDTNDKSSVNEVINEENSEELTPETINDETNESDETINDEDKAMDELVGRYLVNHKFADIDGDEIVPKKAQKKSKAPVIILSIALVCAMLYIGFQSAFIWRLTTGQMEKSSSPISKLINKNSKKEDSEEKEVSTATNPHFSLEEAASVYDPNKKTLSTVEIYNQVYPATVTIYIRGEQDGVDTVLGAGSGFIITDDGYIVTNEHVVSGATSGIEVLVPYADESYVAELVGVDKQTDIAVLKISSDEKFPTVTLGDSDLLQNGELCVAIGSPLGSFDGSITAGIISGVERPMNNNGYSMNLIQTDASVNSGNSGGALINSFGEVIGVVNAKIASAEGLGFAIPINSVKDVIESIIINGKVVNRPYLGITVYYVAPDSYFGAKEGVYVNDFKEDGPGDQAGVMVGDKIVSMDGVEIKESNDIILVRDSHKCGDAITVIVEREGEKVELTLVIGDSADYDE